MSGWSEIERAHGAVKTERQREEGVWRELARFLRPDNVSMDVSEQRLRDASDDPYDSTPIYALDDFVNGTFTKATNPAERWFELTIANKDLAAFAPVKRWLWDYADIIFSSLHPGIDNFYLAAPAWFADLGGFGTGVLWQEEIVGEGRIATRALPIGECYKSNDANGDPSRFHREFMLKGHMAKAKFAGRFGSSAFRDDEDIRFVHAIYPNPGYVQGSPMSSRMRFRSCYASPDKRDFLSEGGFNELPSHLIEWNVRSGKSWATGPGHNALADMRTADETARLTLTAMQFDAEPMWIAQDESVMTTSDIQPANVLYGDFIGGKPPAQLVERAKQLQLPLQMQEQLRNSIRRAFRFGLSQVLANRPQMTAQEVLAYNADELKQLAPNLVRIQRGLSGFIGRRAQILQRMGRVPPPPPELLQAGVPITVEFVSPFAKAQKAEVAKGAIGWVNTLEQSAQAAQDPSIMDAIDFDGFGRLLHDALSGEPTIIRDPRDIAQRRQARQAAQQEQIRLANEAQEASTYSEVAHADQASTLARGRASR